METSAQMMIELKEQEIFEMTGEQLRKQYPKGMRYMRNKRIYAIGNDDEARTKIDVGTFHVMEDGRAIGKATRVGLAYQRLHGKIEIL
jgi:hypothetical protein